MSTLNSAIYAGQVRHRRTRPAPHAFRNRLFMVYLDLSELPTLFRGRWLWSARRPALARFRREDHMGPPGQPLDQAVREQPDVLDEPEPAVLFQDFADNALLFEVYFWTLLRPGADLRRLRSDVRFRIDELFRENGIVIAFPQRDVHLFTKAPIEFRRVEE